MVLYGFIDDCRSRLSRAVDRVIKGVWHTATVKGLAQMPQLGGRCYNDIQGHPQAGFKA